jgi:hypothetical protein
MERGSTSAGQNPTPIRAVQVPPCTNQPFELPNPFKSLASTEDESQANSQQSQDLLTLMALFDATAENMTASTMTHAADRALPPTDVLQSVNKNSGDTMANVPAMVTYDNAIYMAISAAQPDIANVLCRQKQAIQALDNKWANILDTYAAKQMASLASLLGCVWKQVDESLHQIKVSIQTLEDKVWVVQNMMKGTMDLSFAPIKASIGGLDKILDGKITELNKLINETISNYGGLFCQPRKDINNHGRNYGCLSRTALPKLYDRLKVLEAQLMAAVETPPHVSGLTTTSTLWENNNYNNQHTRETRASDTGTSNVDCSRNSDGERPTDGEWLANVNAHTCTVYATFCECNDPDSQSFGNLDHNNPPYPPRGCPRNTYLPSAHPPNLCQTTIPKSFRCGTHHDRPAKVDTANVVGVAIVSPCNGDRAMQARKLGAGHFDIMKLATKEYHVRMHSIDLLNKELIQDCGYG